MDEEKVNEAKGSKVSSAEYCRICLGSLSGHYIYRGILNGNKHKSQDLLDMPVYIHGVSDL